MTVTEALLPTEEPMWSLDTEIGSGKMFWRRDSSKVKFQYEVEVLEFVRDPEEELYISKRDFHHSFREEQNTSHPIVVISTCICAIAVTVLLPWLMIGSNEPIE